MTLTFSEEPDPSLATIKLTGPRGAPVGTGSPMAVPGDPRSLAVRVPTLAKGVYAVNWRVVSRIDGHPTGSTFFFGVGVTPEQAQLATAATASNTPAASPMEILGRFLFLAGVVMLLGAACAGAGGFGGERRGLPVAAVAWPVTAIGLLVLAIAQRSSAAVGFADFLDTYAGRAVQGRRARARRRGRGPVGRPGRSIRDRREGRALDRGRGVRGDDRRARFRGARGDILRRDSMDDERGPVVTLRGRRSLDRRPGRAGHRHSRCAVRIQGDLGPAVLPGSCNRIGSGRPDRGRARSLVALGSWDELVSTGYGQVILAKVALVGVIGLLALRNRLRSVPAAATNLNPLRRVSAGELTVAGVAIVAAAVLGALSPPVDVPPLGLAVNGTDASGAVEAHLVTQWAVPGPNRFDVRLDDRATGRALDATRVDLRFVPLDDPGIPASTLRLKRGTESGSWFGSGTNLAFPGRWRVSAVAGSAAESRVVPLELYVNGPPLFLSVDAFPGQPVRYSVQLADNGFIRLTVEPAGGARQRITVEFFDYFSEKRPVNQLVLTAKSPDEPTRQLPVRRRDASSFVSRARLAPGRTRIDVIARTADGTRLYGTYTVDVAVPEK